jgi:hypothetical protein
MALRHCILVLALLAPTEARADKPLEMSSRRVFLNPEDRTAERVGALLWRGGIELDAEDEDFGGLSGLLISADRRTATMVGDRGRWVTARLVQDAEGRLVGATDGRIGALVGPDGEGLEGKQQKDAESLAALADGALLVSFEHDHRILRYPPAPRAFGRPPVVLDAPPALADLPRNKGLEALAVLDGGRLVAITQGRDADADIAAFLRQDGRWFRLSYPKHGAYTPTGATVLPNGDLLVLERRFNWLGGPAARLVAVEAARVRPGGVLEGREIAEIRLPLTVDNMEGVAARRGSAGETLIYLLSDDNFSPLQRTLLMLFALEE